MSQKPSKSKREDATIHNCNALANAVKNSADLNDFFARCQEFCIAQEKERFRSVRAGLNQIRKHLPRLRQQEQQFEARLSPEFNVYRILRLERKEVLVHTPMLGELLDPAGSHGQGFAFLRTFFQVAASRGLVAPADRFERVR